MKYLIYLLIFVEFIYTVYKEISSYDSTEFI